MKRNRQRDNYGLSLHSKQKRLFILATPIFASFLVIFGAIYYFLNSNQANALVTKVIYISAGSYHSIAVNSNGDLYSWGWNGQGQLGNGTNTDSNVPLPVRTAGTPMAGKKIVHVSTGGNFYKGSSLALSSEGKVYSWGANDQGQLGNGTAINSNLPVEVKTEGTPMAGKKIIQTAIGVTHSMALDSEGKVYSWGENVNGLLGTGDAMPALSPVLVETWRTPMAGKKIIQISAGGAHSMALDSEGNIYAWGWGGEGQLGNGENNNSNVPILVKKEDTGLEGKTIKKVMAGGMFSMVLTSDGSLYSWGKNNYGQIGDGTTNNYNLAVAVKTEGTPMAGKTVVDFSISNEHTVALTSDGQIYAWGRNESGQLGDGTNTASTLPVAVRTVGTPFADKKAVQVVAGGWEGAHSLALGTDGTVYSWGRNLNGQLGDQTTNDTTIVTFAKINFNSSPTPPLKAMAISGESSAEVRWSTPIFDGTFTISDYVIQYRETGTEAWSEVTTSGSNTSKQITGLTNEKVYQFRVAAKTNAGVGDYSLIVLAMPHKKPTITSVTPVIGPTEGNQEVTINGTDFALKTNKLNQVSVCVNCSIALSMDGKVFSWGSNQDGKLGDGNSGNANNVNVPVAVKTEGTPMKGKTISQISSGYVHNLALSMDGKVYAWGDNAGGQLGDGTINNRKTPVAVKTNGTDMDGKTIVQVSAGSYHNVALSSDGKLYAWGNNSDGQLGDGTINNRNVPVAVKTTGTDMDGKTIVQVSAGDEHTIALDAEGNIYEWGTVRGSYSRNTTPQLFNVVGTVIANKIITKVVASSHYSVAITSDGTVYAWGNNSNFGINSKIPVKLDFSGKNIESISLGNSHALAIASDGTVYAWGNNVDGQLGNGTNASSTVPVKVNTIGDLPTNKALKVDAGYSHSLVVTTNGDVYAWGNNVDGQLGNGTNVESSTPVLVKTESPSAFASPNVKATFDNLSATDVTLVNSTKITVKTPAHNMGLVDVSIDLGDGDDIYKATKASSYTYNKVPSKPINLIATPLENGIQINWDQPLDDGGNPITGYTLEYSEDNGLTWQTVSQVITGTNYAISTPTIDPAKKYVFRVAASNIVGRGPYSDTAEGQVRYITLDAPNSVDIDVTPANGARMSSNLTQVNTKTNSPSGHKLALSMDGAEQKLLNGSHFISPTSGTFASPITLNGSSWGYRVASVGGFGSGGSVELNVVISAHKWAGVPVKAIPHVIKTKNTANTTLEQTTVYYGASVDADQRSGSYKATVLYTAINN